MSPAPPDALLIITPDCPHCTAILHGVGELVKQGLIGRMTVVNATTHPEEAEQHGVRAAPWLRLGPFTLTGAHSAEELRRWADWANGDEGAAHYVEHLLKEGRYRHATAFIAEDTRRLGPLLSILANTDASIDIRLGVSALLEAYTNRPDLRRLLPQLAELTRHVDHRVRADACHLLGRTGCAEARAYVGACLGDAHEEVREIAQEAMEELETAM